MSRVHVTGAKRDGEGKIETLRVMFDGLPSRVIDRDTVIAWLRDGHSLLVDRIAMPLVALQLVEIAEGDDLRRFVRDDTTKEPADHLPDLPTP